MYNNNVSLSRPNEVYTSVYIYRDLSGFKASLNCPPLIELVSVRCLGLW